MSALLYNGNKDISHERESRCINMLFVILVLYIIGIAIITIAIFISIGYAIQYLTAALYGL
ncbi:TPA: hypothetical protein PDS20_002626 [Staphylococcus aureus]|nr:hypothetical protein [Staphylococcus aureus]